MAASKEKVNPFKVILVGECNVGKTSIFMRVNGEEFSDSVPTLSADYMSKDIKLDNGVSVSLQIFDTAGMERLRSITPNYFRGAHAVVFVYDLDALKTFEELDTWEQHVRNHESNTRAISRFIIGNKSDLEGSIPDQKFSDFCQMCEVVKDFKTSAKTGDGIDDAFKHIAKYLAETTARRWSTAIEEPVTLGLQNTPDDSKCPC